MSTRPRVAPRRVTPRHLGVAAAVYGVFVAGWYLGQPVTPECRIDQAALDGLVQEEAIEPSPAPAPTKDPFHSRSGTTDSVMVATFTIHAVSCTNDVTERPRLEAWLEVG